MLRRPVVDERGIALISVILIAAILMALVVGMSAFAVSSLDLSRHDQDWNAALAAAEAGIDDYLYRLNNDDSYWLYGPSPKLPPPDGNQAFTQWVPVPGPSNEAEFTYTVDSATVESDGSLKVTSTGRVRNTTRTVRSTLRPGTFLDYLYFTEYETRDPLSYSLGTQAWAAANCMRHYYDSPPRDPACGGIDFISRDTLKGPLHSNDAIKIAGDPNFLGPASTSWEGVNGQRWRGSGNPQFIRPGDPALADPLTIPPSNSSIKAEADVTAGSGKTGCLFTGPTSIKLNPGGTMTVASPISAVGKTSSVPGKCLAGTVASPATGPLPANGVIYVQGVPTDSSDPNYPTGLTLLTDWCSTGRNALGYPLLNGDITGGYGCFDGDVFVSGQLNGRLTIASVDSIIVTGDTTYVDQTDDVLGLVADNFVEVYHPVDGAGNELAFVTDIDIHAAILTVKHSFTVQNWGSGDPRGKLTVLGAIAQEFRGVVGTHNGTSVQTGYEKNYNYDQRLRYQSPPHFLDPVKSAWGQATWSELRQPATCPATVPTDPCIPALT